MKHLIINGERVRWAIPENYNTMNLDELIQKRRQWYLDNEYKEFDDLPPFIQLRLDTELRRDKEVIEWVLKLQYDG